MSVVGPAVDQAIADLAFVTVNDIEITVRAFIREAWFDYQTHILSASGALEGQVQIALALNGGRVNPGQGLMKRGGGGGLTSSSIGFAVLQNLNPGDVLTIEALHNLTGGQDIVANQTLVRMMAWGPEIRDQGIMEDTG